MNIIPISFKLNTKEEIKIELNVPITTLYPCDEVTIKLFYQDSNYILSIDCIREEIESLYNLISAAIDNKAQLHESIIEDIGYLWNEELQDKEGLTYVKSEEIDYWVGMQNLLWATPGTVNPRLDTWIYNDLKGDIILEITPCYPWHYMEPEVDEDFIPYDDWLKTYKPLLIYTLSRETALIWKKQAAEILDTIEKNTQHSDQNEVTFITNSKYKEFTKRSSCIPLKNGQKALDNSIAYSKNAMGRVGINENSFVVFYCDRNAVQLYERKYHGHIRTWNLLEEDMKNALIHAGLVDARGNIL